MDVCNVSGNVNYTRIFDRTSMERCHNLCCSAKRGFRKTIYKKCCYGNWKSQHKKHGRANVLTGLSFLIYRIKYT